MRRPVAVLLAGVCCALLAATGWQVSGLPITTVTQLDVERLDGRPVPFTPVRQPGMAEPGRAAMHGDAANSDAHPYPLAPGRRMQLVHRDTTGRPGGACATTTFTKEGRIVALCADFGGFIITLLDPGTLKTLATHRLEPRPTFAEGVLKQDPGIITSDTSGGAYFYLDDADRVVLADSRQHIVRLAHSVRGDRGEFHVDGEWDLSAVVPHDCFTWTHWSPGECDPMTAVLPDRDGRIWWVTRQGRIGTLDPRDGQVRVTTLPGEQIQNSFAADGQGVYIVSDHAVYGMRAGADGVPQTIWRSPYDRGSGRKQGSINQGSGTTPTLLGDDWLAITDNADGRINLVVLDRRMTPDGGRPVCSTPLFTDNASATDNSVVAIGKDSVIAENNAGYTDALRHKDFRTVKGGITRIDVVLDPTSGHQCRTRWESPVVAPSSVPKLSAPSGLVLVYTAEASPDGDADATEWAITGLDAATGRIALRIPTGRGSRLDNNWAPVSVGPDGRIYAGVFSGMIAVTPR